jgi:hypothetical protein
MTNMRPSGANSMSTGDCRPSTIFFHCTPCGLGKAEASGAGTLVGSTAAVGIPACAAAVAVDGMKVAGAGIAAEVEVGVGEVVEQAAATPIVSAAVSASLFIATGL